jgi:pimeloyl-ACP methyl ester carboxylesterase
MTTRILLLHGWDWRKYPAFNPEHQWLNRLELIHRLREVGEVDFPSMPGFDRIDRAGAWTLDEYASWLDTEIAQRHYDAVIGYSFGCAVATHWKYTHRRPEVPLILVSPAVTRAYTKPPNRTAIGVANAMKRLHMDGTVRALRGVYLTRIVKNKHVIHATPFLRATYSNIVGVDLSHELQELLADGHRVTCVFGSDDSATPPQVLFAKVPAARGVSLVIPGGTHDIGTTHPAEIADHVGQFLRLPKARDADID